MTQTMAENACRLFRISKGFEENSSQNTQATVALAGSSIDARFHRLNETMKKELLAHKNGLVSRLEQFELGRQFLDSRNFSYAERCAVVETLVPYVYEYTDVDPSNGGKQTAEDLFCFSLQMIAIFYQFVQVYKAQPTIKELTDVFNKVEHKEFRDINLSALQELLEHKKRNDETYALVSKEPIDLLNATLEANFLIFIGHPEYTDPSDVLLRFYNRVKSGYAALEKDVPAVEIKPQKAAALLQKYVLQHPELQVGAA